MSSSPIIRTDGIRKSFGEVEALKSIDLEVAEGSVFGLLGPNGAGKTTAVRILTTLLEPDAGLAVVDGLDVVKDAEALRHRIGLAGQYAAVDENLTGFENLVMVGRLYHLPADEARRRATEVLERFGLTHAGGRPVRTYSGGMRRRLDLGASLVARPKVLFLDEPTTGLDPRSRLSLWEMIRELRSEGTTLLLTTQYLEEADRLAERIAVIDRGLVIAEGTPAELKARLGATLSDLGFASADDAGRAAAAIHAAGDLPDSIGAPRLDGSTLEISVDDGPIAVLHVMRALDADGIAPTTLAVREPSLDDVFLNLTGHRTEDDTPTTDDEAAPTPARGRRGRGAA
jgi:ABC-2 type transport system ATP-binding protein